ncbi:HAMP domain-containing histidine kinase [Schaedlerella arabinosiphila]|uniref:histidine kinase n=1 Tax=Schaedlerella arabinosiphila TaxID=2044587 RepID=A0A9X5C4L1_9FIRM|nr:HAMP domain-containing sensor histidine kinase [Schaedlerella arabinosiphila]KAI4439225.1 Adaptive-response sensory-kinase SasA [Schaedlerella arabinosiphila]MCI9604853.1 HAMP domain-containing histidine kinase [Ruminococcus sp.]NDO67607.1 HAMP domain-containing histidine kinase [Schaedlerella arabinosiphila]
MKSLMKIIRRYVVSATVLVLAVALFNIGVLFFIGFQAAQRFGESRMGAGEQLENVAAQFTVSAHGTMENRARYQLSEEGYAYLEEYHFLWSMLLDEGGNVVWSWRLPGELPGSYGLADVAKFSRWYLMDYPVRVWEMDGMLLVSGYGKEHAVKISLMYPLNQIRSIPQYLSVIVGMNVALFLALSLWFAYRFYYSLRPVCVGIDALAEKTPVLLAEKGTTAELAARLNQASRILEKQDQKLMQRDDARTSWIAGVSHDIRTPLALIMGYSEALTENPKLGEEPRGQAEAIRKQSLLIRQLIEDLNLTSKLEYHAQPLRMQEYCPAVLLRETAAEYYNEGLDERYEITVQAAHQTERIRQQGDVPLLKRALRNVIGNSIRHNPEGCRIMLQLSEDMGWIVWRLWDSGPGIPEKVVDALEGEASGPGEEVHVMGLRIVRQIITAHGGHADFVRNEEGSYGVEFVMPVEFG